MQTIDIVYLTCLGIGVCYALVAFLAGHMHLPHVDIGHDAGAGHIGDIGHVGDVGHVGHVGDVGHIGHVGDVGHIGDVGDAGHVGDVGHAADTGHAVSHDAGHAHAHAEDTESVSFISPITVSTFLAGFGAAGVVTSMGMRLPEVINLPVSFVTATGIAYAGFRLFVRYFIASQSSSESIVAELVGMPAEVSVAITSGCIGAITYTDVGRRYSMPAHAADGQSFEKGTQVFILRVEGGIAEVWQGQPQ
jgi:Collagen triple helix repeat (20 copies)